MYDERNDLHASLYVLKKLSAVSLSPSITDIAVLLSSNEPLQIIFPLAFQSSMIVAIVPAAAATSCALASSLKTLTKTYGDFSAFTKLSLGRY